MTTIKRIVVCVLVLQVVLIGVSIWIVSTGQATPQTYFNIALNMMFGALNIFTLSQ